MLGSVNLPHGRPRATTASSTRSVSAKDPDTAPPRPSHVRSHSYLSVSPDHPKPRNVMSLPIEKDKDKEKRSHEPSVPHIPRIHLPGHRSRHSHDIREPQSATESHRKHRHTRSELPDRTNSSSSFSPLAQAIAGSGSMNESLLYPGIRGGAIPSLVRMASTRSNRSHRGPHELLQRTATGDILLSSHGRRRASSDPKSPSHLYDPSGQQPMSEVELLLDRAERARQLAASQSITDADVARMSAELASSNIELQSRLTDSNHAASSLMRRLDDAHDSLIRTASSLTDTISSFQNLSTQSEALISNFSTTSGQTEKSIHAQLARHQKALFQERGSMIYKLERRGKDAGERAEELGRRLDNARTMIRNWEEKQMNKRRAWKSVFLGTSVGLLLIFCAVMLGLGLWAWKRNSGRGTLAELTARQALGDDIARLVVEGSSGQSDVEKKLKLGAVDVHLDGADPIPNRTQLEQLNVPDEVKILLGDIAVRHQTQGKSLADDSNSDSSEASALHDPPRATKKEEKRMRMLDEL